MSLGMEVGLGPGHTVLDASYLASIVKSLYIPLGIKVLGPGSGTSIEGS